MQPAEIESEWGDFQPHLNTAAVIGICHCPSNPDLAAAVERFRQDTAAFGDGPIRRLFAFEPMEVHWGQQGLLELRELDMFPEDRRTADGDSIVRLHAHHLLCTLGTQLMSRYESRVHTALTQTTDLAMTPLELLSPLDRKSHVGDVRSAKVLRKRQAARHLKHAADYCLLAGSPEDAIRHYVAASAACRATGDHIWHAGAVEGLASAIICRHAVDDNVSPTRVPVLVDASERLLEAGILYRRHRARLLHAQAALKLARYLSKERTARARSTLIAALADATTASRSFSAMHRVALLAEIVVLYERCQMPRKFAFAMLELIAQYHVVGDWGVHARLAAITARCCGMKFSRARIDNVAGATAPALGFRTIEAPSWPWQHVSTLRILQHACAMSGDAHTAALATTALLRVAASVQHGFAESELLRLMLAPTSSTWIEPNDGQYVEGSTPSSSSSSVSLDSVFVELGLSRARISIDTDEEVDVPAWLRHTATRSTSQNDVVASLIRSQSMTNAPARHGGATGGAGGSAELPAATAAAAHRRPQSVTPSRRDRPLTGGVFSEPSAGNSDSGSHDLHSLPISPGGALSDSLSDSDSTSSSAEGPRSGGARDVLTENVARQAVTAGLGASRSSLLSGSVLGVETYGEDETEAVGDPRPPGSSLPSPSVVQAQLLLELSVLARRMSDSVGCTVDMSGLPAITAASLESPSWALGAREVGGAAPTDSIEQSAFLFDPFLGGRSRQRKAAAVKVAVGDPTVVCVKFTNPCSVPLELRNLHVTGVLHPIQPDGRDALLPESDDARVDSDECVLVEGDFVDYELPYSARNHGVPLVLHPPAAGLLRIVGIAWTLSGITTEVPFAPKSSASSSPQVGVSWLGAHDTLGAPTQSDRDVHCGSGGLQAIVVPPTPCVVLTMPEASAPCPAVDGQVYSSSIKVVNDGAVDAGILTVVARVEGRSLERERMTPSSANSPSGGAGGAGGAGRDLGSSALDAVQGSCRHLEKPQSATQWVDAQEVCLFDSQTLPASDAAEDIYLFGDVLTVSAAAVASLRQAMPLSPGASVDLPCVVRCGRFIPSVAIRVTAAAGPEAAVQRVSHLVLPSGADVPGPEVVSVTSVSQPFDTIGESTFVTAEGDTDASECRLKVVVSNPLGTPISVVCPADLSSSVVVAGNSADALMVTFPRLPTGGTEKVAARLARLLRVQWRTIAGSTTSPAARSGEVEPTPHSLSTLVLRCSGNPIVSMSIDAAAEWAPLVPTTLSMRVCCCSTDDLSHLDVELAIVRWHRDVSETETAVGRRAVAVSLPHAEVAVSGVQHIRDVTISHAGALAWTVTACATARGCYAAALYVTDRQTGHRWTQHAPHTFCVV